MNKNFLNFFGILVFSCLIIYPLGNLEIKADTADTSITIIKEETPPTGGGVFIPPIPLEVVLYPSPEHPEIPKSLIINNNNNYTNSLNVVLNLSVKNAFQMAISNSPDFTGISWKDYSPTKNWTLIKGEGEKTVYAKFRSKSGGVSEIVSDTITFDATAPTNVSFLKAESEDEKIKLSWINSNDSDFARVKINRSQKSYLLSPNEGKIIYDGSGTFFIDTNLKNGQSYFYTVFSYDKAGNYSSGAIIFAVPQFLPVPEISSEVPEKIIPEISPKIFPQIPPEIIPLIPLLPQPLINVPQKEKIGLSDFSFQIKTDFDLIKIPTEKLDKIKIVREMPLIISIPSDKFIKEVKTITASITNGFSSSYLLKLNKKTKNFEATISAPFKKGKYKLLLNVIYEDGTLESISTEMLVDPYGYIYEKKKIKGKFREIRIGNAKVFLFWLNPETNNFQLWPAKKYKQKNPQITDATGEYAFMVPKGKYYLEIAKDEYYQKTTDKFEVIDEVINLNIELRAIPSFWQKFFWVIILIGMGVMAIIIKALLIKRRK